MKTKSILINKISLVLTLCTILVFSLNVMGFSKQKVVLKPKVALKVNTVAKTTPKKIIKSDQNVVVMNPIDKVEEANLNNQITDLTKQLEDLMNTEASIKNDVDTLNKEGQPIYLENKDLRKSIDDIYATINSAGKKAQAAYDINNTLTIDTDAIQQKISELQADIPVLQKQVDKLNDIVSSNPPITPTLLNGWYNTGDFTANSIDNIEFLLPYISGSDKIEGISLVSQDGSNTTPTYEVNGSSLIVHTNMNYGQKYVLKMYTQKAKYEKNITVKDFPTLNNAIENVIKVPANPKKGFNYSYYLYIPKNLQQLSQRRLLVEGDNSAPSDDNRIFEYNAEDLATNLGYEPHWIGRDMQLPVLIPAFPRPIDYTEYPQFLNRGVFQIQGNDMYRTDLQLIAMINDAQKLLANNGINVADRVFLTGYSASAKFAERFSILHPDKVMAVVAGGVGGLTTLPMSEYQGQKLRFPVGVDDLKTLIGNDFDSNSFSKVPEYLYMGETDTNDATNYIDCYETQDYEMIWSVLGRQIPQRWAKTQEILSGYNIQFHTYKGIGHEINPITVQDAENFFTANWNGNQLVKITPHE